MKNPKLVAIVVAVVLLVIVVLQNTKQADVQILFFTVKISRALLLFLMLAVGFLLGLLTRKHLLGRGEKGGEPPEG